MKTYILPLLAVITLFSSCHHREKTVEDTEPRAIEVAEVTTDSVILHKSYPGYLSSGSTANVVSLVEGRIIYKEYAGGSIVEKGQILFKVDPSLYEDAVQQAEASLASAISQSEYAKSRCEAVKKAFEAEAVSKMEVLSAESNLRQAEANVKDCRAALHTAQTQLGYCTIKAPMAGIIDDSNYGVGDYISGSKASPLLLSTIYDNTKLTAEFEIEDAQYEKMVGRTMGVNDPIYREIPLQFRVDLLHKYTASLTYEAPAVNRSTGTIKLKGSVINQDFELKDGMYVTIDLPYGADPHAMLIRDASIGSDQLGKYVYVVNDSNKVVYTPIKVGETFQDSLRVVESGLRPGDRYVTKALLSVRNGETVKPVLTK